MKSINLIPSPRREARRRARQRRRCAIGCAAYAAVLSAACSAAWGVWDQRDPGTDGRLGDLAGQIRRTEAKVAAARAEFAAVQSQLQASRIVAGQPDWSLLLAVLGTKTGEDVVLRGLRVLPVDAAAPAGPREGVRNPPGQAAAPAAPRGPAVAGGAGQAAFQLNLNGLARSPLAVSQFVLRLEQAGLFRRVALRDTGREPFLGGEAVSFRLECAFDDSPGGAGGNPAGRPTGATASTTGGVQ